MSVEWLGIKEKFYLDGVVGGDCSSSKWEDVEDCLRKKFSREISFLKPNMFTYFVLLGVPVLIVALFIMKVFAEHGTPVYYLVKLVFIVSAMFSLKGFVGHFVVVFLNRDRFESDLKMLRSNFI